MNIKHRKLLFVAAVIDVLLGIFYIGSGILEFTNALKTSAHTITQTIGVQLSYLVFISAILTTATGVLSIIFNKTLRFLNLRVFFGISSLAWPLFLSITLFFTQLQINIRLSTMTLASLYYVVAVLIVKITNTEFSKGVKFNPSAMIASSGKRSKSVNIGSAMSATAGMLQQKNIAHTVDTIASVMTPRKANGINLRWLFVGKRRKAGGGIFRALYSGQKRRNLNIIALLFNNKRRHSHFRLRRR